MVKQIPLTQGKVALVDDEDYLKVSVYRWYAHHEATNWYAKSGTKLANNKLILLHRLIMDAKPNEHIDHIDSNGLNNQKSNLRIANNQQNHFNMRKRRINNGKICISKYKGVSKSYDKWRAYITKDGKFIHLGRFNTEEEAARAYNVKAIEFFGKYAKINKELDTCNRIQCETRKKYNGQWEETGRF